MSGRLRGGISILASAVLFYLATFFVKLGSPSGTFETLVYTAFRFWIGYAALLIWFWAGRKTRASEIKTVNVKWLWYRAFWNLVAVIFFYLGVVYGTVTGANILNMTYPAFVAILSIYILNERPDLVAWLGVVFAISGAVLVSMTHEGYRATPGDIFSMLSAVTSGIAIVALRKIRLTDSTEAALFYNFRLGFWVLAFPMLYYFLSGSYVISGSGMLYPVLSGVSGFLGQIALTYGFKYISAVEGSILSSMRLVFAVILGWIFFHAETGIYNISGAALILLANLLLARPRN